MSKDNSSSQIDIAASQPETPTTGNTTLHDDELITLEWKNINYKIKIKEKKKEIVKSILTDVSGKILPGEMTAILGPSGSGKTTLLNILAGRIEVDSQSSELTGDIRVNNRTRGIHWRRQIGYVEQEDVMYGHLKVKETIEYAAKLKLPKVTAESERSEKVNEIIREFGLNKCSETLIGTNDLRGVSGGEKKRTSIAVELVTDPKCLFLDEPTSGLDAFTAYSIVEVIGTLAKEKKKTVLCTIHQPRTDILFQFSKIILLAEGQVVWFGTVSDALKHFASLGFNCPNLVNPADFFLDQITINFKSENSEKISTENLKLLQLKWKEKEKEMEGLEGQPGSDEKTSATWSTSQPLPDNFDKEIYDANRINWGKQFLILFHRNLLLLVRRKREFLLSVIQTIFLALLFGFVYFQLSEDQAGIQNRIGYLFLVIVNNAFTTVNPLVQIFAIERLVLRRERNSATYKVSAYFLSKSIASLPTVLFTTILFACINYYIVGLNPGADHFFIFIGVMLSVCFFSASLGLAIASLVPNVQVAAIVAPMFLVICLLFGGNVANNESITWILRWLQYISLVFYGYSALSQNEFTGLTFTCETEPCSPGYTTGEQVISAYGLATFPIFVDCLALVGLALVLQCCGYLGLRWTTKPKGKVI